MVKKQVALNRRKRGKSHKKVAKYVTRICFLSLGLLFFFLFPDLSHNFFLLLQYYTASFPKLWKEEEEKRSSVARF